MIFQNTSEAQIGSFRLDPVNQCLWRGTDQTSLSPKAFSVLHYLAERAGRLVTKQELLDAVWPDIHVTEGVLKRTVVEIRKALDDSVDEPQFIQTLHRRGYRFLRPAGGESRHSEQSHEEAGMVGRAKELLQLKGWFDLALQSSRQVIFIAGEAGLGKTTLVEQWMRSLRKNHSAGHGEVATAHGRCLRHFGRGEPYLPVFEALDQLSQQFGRRLVEILRAKAPTWLMHMPALISLEDRAKLRAEVPGSTHERMLREITDALEALSAEVPLVIALEDMHWSDPSTIDLLSSIASRTSPARLMILATYRPADAARNGSPLLVTRNELALHKRCRTLPLAYLSENEVAEYLTSRFAGMNSLPTIATALHQRTSGNPLYVGCIVDELTVSGRIKGGPETVGEFVPDTLQQMFERQAAQLTGPEQELLEAAAVAGESFSIAALAAALGWDGAQVELLCEALVRQHLILKRGAPVRLPEGGESPGYSFVHALCRDALYRNIRVGLRSRLHGLLGRSEKRLSATPLQVASHPANRFADGMAVRGSDLSEGELPVWRAGSKACEAACAA